VAHAADAARGQRLPRALKDVDLGELEIDDVAKAALVRSRGQALAKFAATPERLLGEQVLSGVHRALQYLRLGRGRNRDADHVDLGIVDQVLPARECSRDADLTGDGFGALGSRGREPDHVEARVAAERRHVDSRAEACADDANARGAFHTDHLHPGAARSPVNSRFIQSADLARS
jgi:hypothetical protein